MTTRPFKTLEEAVEYLYSEQIEADVLALPPEVDKLTDEDNVDDGDLDVPLVTDISGYVEINIQSSDDDFDSEDDLPLSTFSISVAGPSTLSGVTPTRKKRRN
jgi:hypothetical protein